MDVNSSSFLQSAGRTQPNPEVWQSFHSPDFHHLISRDITSSQYIINSLWEPGLGEPGPKPGPENKDRGNKSRTREPEPPPAASLPVYESSLAGRLHLLFLLAL